MHELGIMASLLDDARGDVLTGAWWTLVVPGLALGALGDFFLTRRAEAAFLAGMGAFAAGHLAYAGWMFTPVREGTL